MRRIGIGDHRNPAVNLHGEGKHGFKTGNLQIGEPASTPGAEWFNAQQEELANVVESEMPLDPNDNTQLLQSLRRISAKSGQDKVQEHENENNPHAQYKIKDLAKFYGAVADGVADDTHAFSALEQSYKGQPINLRCGRFNALKIPTGAKYFNGSFISGGQTVQMPMRPFAHPLDGASGVAFGDGVTHYWLFDMLYVPTIEKLIALVAPSTRHATPINTPLNIIFSDDLGQTWYRERTIYSVKDAFISDANLMMMGNGRIGAYCRVTQPGVMLRNDFIYSDNNCATWSVKTNIFSDTNTLFPYADAMPYPAAVGGHNLFGHIVYGYGNGDCQAHYTVDNGATWARKAMGFGGSSCEPSVVKIADNKYIAFIRTAGNMLISTSSNMIDWNTPVDSGVALLGHPVYALYDYGKVYVYLFIRGWADNEL